MSRALLASVLAFFLLGAPTTFVGAQENDPNRDGPNAEAKSLLARGEDTEKAKPEDALAIYKQLIDKFPGSPQIARAHLRMGLCLAKLGRNEDARAQLREARKLGKDDEQVQKEAEKALIALPPPAEKKDEPKPAEPKPAEPKKPEPAKPAPEAGPKGELQVEIEKLEGEKRELTKKAQDLDDAGKTAEAYQVRAELDKKVAQIEKKKKELAGLKNAKPAPTNKEQKREEKKAEKKGDEKPAEKSKLMLDRKEDFEAAARAKLQDAIAAVGQNRPHEVASALGEYHRLRREAEQLGKKAAAGKERTSLEEGLKKARDNASAAEKSGNADAAKKAKDEVASAEKALRDFDAANQDSEQKAKIDRLASDLKRRGAQPFEIDERVALAKRELQLDEEHRQAIANVQKDIDEKKITEPDGRERTTRMDREHHKKIERLRDEVEGRVHEHARADMEKELARRSDEMRKNGVAEAEIEQKIATARRELEAKLPGRRVDSGPKLAETSGTEPTDHQKRVRELVEENKKLKKRIDDLEKENAQLKGKKGPQDATAPN